MPASDAKPVNAITRRRALGLAAAAPLLLGATPRPAKALMPVKVAWLPGAVCVAPLPVGLEKGIFARHGLDLKLVDHAFHDQAFLESPTNGGSDAAATMIGNWLPEIRKGLPVRVLTAVHGGCVRVLGSAKTGVTRTADLKGKTIAVGGPPELARAVYSVMLVRNGIDPNRDVAWVQVKDEDLEAAFAAGRAHAVGSLDPVVVGLQRRLPHLVEVMNNESGPFEGKGCCVLAAGEALWKDRPEAAAALVMALNEASDYTAAHPEEAAALFAQRSPFPQADVLASMKRTAFHAHHRNMNLRQDMEFYVQGYKDAGLFPADLDVATLVDRAYAPIVC